MASYEEEYLVIGYQKAQKEIAARLLAEDMKVSFVASVTNLSEEIVERIKLDHSPRLKKIARNMLKDGMDEHVIARLLEIPVHIVNEVKEKMEENK
jgi:hypothetical protein